MNTDEQDETKPLVLPTKPYKPKNGKNAGENNDTAANNQAEDEFKLPMPVG